MIKQKSFGLAKLAILAIGLLVPLAACSVTDLETGAKTSTELAKVDVSYDDQTGKPISVSTELKFSVLSKPAGSVDGDSLSYDPLPSPTAIYFDSVLTDQPKKAAVVFDSVIIEDLLLDVEYSLTPNPRVAPTTTGKGVGYKEEYQTIYRIFRYKNGVLFAEDSRNNKRYSRPNLLEFPTVKSSVSKRLKAVVSEDYTISGQEIRFPITVYTDLTEVDYEITTNSNASKQIIGNFSPSSGQLTGINGSKVFTAVLNANGTSGTTHYTLSLNSPQSGTKASYKQNFSITSRGNLASITINHAWDVAIKRVDDAGDISVGIGSGSASRSLTVSLEADILTQTAPDERIVSYKWSSQTLTFSGSKTAKKVTIAEENPTGLVQLKVTNNQTGAWTLIDYQLKSPESTTTPKPTITPQPKPQVEQPKIRTWQQITAKANWLGRREHTTVAFKGKIWLLGGIIGKDNNNHEIHTNEIWNSADGSNWTQVNANPKWAARAYHTSLVFKNKLWVIGGSGDKNDVWSSADGSNWTEVTAKSAKKFPGRAGHTSLVFHNKMWVIGGATHPNARNDVWSSVDGSNWIEETANSKSKFPARTSHTSVMFGEKIGVIGGIGANGDRTDVWTSADGRVWNKVHDFSWPAPRYLTSVVFDNKIWLMGGHGSKSARNDVWYYSTDNGWFWYWREQPKAPWSARYGHSSVVFNNKIWVIGGAGANNKRDVWAFDY